MKSIIWFFIGVMLTNVVLPVFYTQAYAGGPTQPEVQSFSPIGVTDMVDPFTGDFHYNIPLMDIEGYPVNLVYNSGVSMEQEASWVGLGWNINTGAIMRSMRGLPDDFNGDLVTKETNHKPAQNFEIGVGEEVEIFGKSLNLNLTSGATGSLNASMSLNYNTFNGFGAGFSFGPSFSVAKRAGAIGTAGFQLSGSSENGASWKADVNYSNNTAKKHKLENKIPNSFSIGGNTRSGLQFLSFTRSFGSRRKLNNTFVGVRGRYGASFDLGLHSYTPTAGPDMNGLAITASWKFPGELFGVAGDITIRGSYSRQAIKDDYKILNSPAYGFFSLEKGQRVETALLDFNRDNDESFTKYTPFLPSAHLTPDLFSVQAHGIDGSFRGFRNEVGYVFDPIQKTTNNDGSIAVETGSGNLLKFGVDIAYSHITSESGAWNGGLNNASNTVAFETPNDPLETFALQNASELSVDADQNFEDNFSTDLAMMFKLAGIAALPILKSAVTHFESGSGSTVTSNNREHRIKRNQSLYYRTVEEVQHGLGISPVSDYPINAMGQPHHIGEITELATDGRRYVFGLPVYNTSQEDVTFAIGANLSNQGGLTGGDPSIGLIDYAGSEILTSINNDKGIDHFYSGTKTPAYAHSFMLTSILSDDYIDNDGIQGPSLNDLGSYVKFSYTKFDNFRWRSPIQQNQAYLNQGLKTDPTDDKASFTTGTKELAYVKTIETKNYVAVFHISPSRNDASSAVNRHGGTTNSVQMQRLDSISLYSRPEYEAHPGTDIVNALPIQRVHFRYEDDITKVLCPDYPIGNAKLTLKEVYFTYQNSQKMRRSSYSFEYFNNPHYKMRDVDRWGNYQPQSDPDGLLSCDFPYTRQNKTDADQYASAWLLTRITLPSGGHIVVDYEADDYAYVQNLPAMQMFKIMGVEGQAIPGSGSEIQISAVGNRNPAIVVKINQDFIDPALYASAGDELYFRCLVDLSAGSVNHEYISGYGKVNEVQPFDEGGVHYLKITFEPENLRDGDPLTAVSPITKSALQFGRMHMSRYIRNVGNSPADAESMALYDLATALFDAFASLKEMFTGPNAALYQMDRGKYITTGKSFIRLKEPSGHKLGGGSRVKQIQMFDNWSSMSDGYQAEASYGQTFEYVDEQGKSSGVASYEPLIGADENPWHTPVKYADKKVMAPDDMLYMETPLMESQFPNPEVGYSRVVISDLNQGQEYSRTNTGEVVKEFYTAKDYPTRVFSSDLEVKTMNSFLPLVPKYQYLTASQGFVIENNDMHGKPKSEQVYAVGGTSPISRVDYFYKTTGDNLSNTVSVIGSNGQVSNAEIGVRREGVADFRRSETLVLGGAAQVNVDMFIIPLPFPIPPITVPTVWPSVDISDNQFRSATLNKVVTRFGLLERTVAKQDGSVVETKNLAYDAETGEVLVTQTTTDFNDAVYSLNFPAYWMHPQVAAAYSNINLEVKATAVDATGTFTVVGMGSNYYPGDELIVRSVQSDNTVTWTKGWVLSAATNTVKVVDKAGDPVVPDAVNMYLKVIRSGHRNKQTASMASVTMLNNPLEDNSLASGSYQNVLNAGAVEFGENWRTYCNCFDPASSTYTTNPYVLGILGNWRPVKSLTYLTGRSQTNFHGNTNIRKNGVFTSFSPYYSLSEGMTWQPQPTNWTFVSQVTEFSPNGMTLETKDALGRFSASKFGFNNTLTTAVAANTQLRQLEYASFEDNQYSNCTDQQVFTTDVANVSTTEAHSGYKSLKVAANSSLTFGVANDYCAPAGACELGLEIDNTDTPGLAILNGAGPYTLETQLLAGSGFAALSTGDRIDLTYDNTRNLEIIITIHDKNGCIATYKYVHAAGDPGAQLQRQ